jgi:glycosyltransferase involved in cell wall biosynthesis
MSSHIKLDIITSAFNEEICLPELYRRIKNVMGNEIQYEWRLIAIDNGSVDKTWSVLKEIVQNDSRVLAIRMSRNFDLDAAFTCGLDMATADIAIIMCSDLQDPPEVIPLFLRKYEEGFEQVAARIVKRDEVPIFRRLASILFYKLANKLTNNRIPQNISDFRLITRSCYLAFQQMREHHRFIRGLFSWVGFKTAFIDIERPSRYGGESTFLQLKFFRVFQWAFTGILSHTTTPLLWISGIGLFFSFISISSLVIFVIFWLIVGVPFAGYGSIIAAIATGFSLVLLCLGVISQYLAIVVEQIKERPLYVVAEVTGRAEK